MPGKKHALFISHAFEDKEDLVRPLAVALEQLDVRVWYDEFSLSLGDSLSASIDRGLKESRYCLIVISPNFIKKSWTEYEFRSLLTLELGERKRILPLWHNIGRPEVLNYSPQLADRFAISTQGYTPGALALAVLKVVEPKKFETINRRSITQRLLAEGKLPLADAGALRHRDPGPPLTISQLSRVRLIHETLFEVWPQAWEEAVEGFRRDSLAGRDKEIAIWEAISGTYLRTCRNFDLDIHQRKNLLSQLTLLSMGIRDTSAISPTSWPSFAEKEFLSGLSNDRSNL
ncbi:toll/interleukin-1 receptor domain-containing protein [Streptomyces sp. NPDC056010]|uniref:toll/interleukin-1 receptor domain-containing protein n=1 Tax=Streptomyces sp. NPDC056010 TaxID=3345679 RepID=UPI0035E0601D